MPRRSLRSVFDFPDEPAIRAALLPATAVSDDEDDGNYSDEEMASHEDLDWVVPNADPAISVEQTISDEVKRLMVLKSYLDCGVVDDRIISTKFQSLVDMAARLFNAPMVALTVVDLGRVFFLGKTGFDFEEVERKASFASHTILSKEDFFVVHDASADERFAEDPKVKGAGKVRFYAGTSLMSPEGYKLGSFCLLDVVSRPNGLSDADAKCLKDLTNMAMDALVEFRTQHAERTQVSTQQLAMVSHHLLTPLTGVQLSLSLLKDDMTFAALSEQQRECIATAVKCASVMEQICASLRQQNGDSNNTVSAIEPEMEREQKSAKRPPAMDSAQLVPSSVVHLKDLIDRLQWSVSSWPSSVPVTIVVDPKLPSKMLGEEDEIFNAAYSLLTALCDQHESLCLYIQRQAKPHNPQESELRFVCEDGRDYKCKDLQSHNKPTSCSLTSVINNGKDKSKYADLISVQSRVRAVGGDFGMESLDDGNSRFWFTIPCLCPDEEVAKFSAKRPRISSSVATIQDDSKLYDCNCVKRALVIDDSIIVRKTIVKALSSFGYEVEEATNGMAGLKCLKDEIFDFVFVDFVMPMMDGMDCIQLYRQWEAEHRPGFRQYIVGISAHTNTQDIDRGLSHGIDSFRSKPVTSEDLKSVISTADRLLSSTFNDCSGCARCDRAQRFSNVQSTISRSRLLEDEEKAVLIATDNGKMYNNIQSVACGKGWATRQVTSTTEALSMLKSKNWAAVMIDSELSQQSGFTCIQEFRRWEKDNRICRQTHLYYISRNVRDHSSSCSVPLPAGIDGVLKNPLKKAEIEKVVNDLD